MGGVRRVSQLLGVHRTRVYVWLRPVSKGGTGGRIPIKHIPLLLSEAKRIGVPIKAEDFLSFSYNSPLRDSVLSPTSTCTDSSTVNEYHQDNSSCQTEERL
uniref:Uncharacterized protein n=1 Tax=Bartonella schoenbuchensis (strain DSM 13525 / NCTC 13165 / R1) TaxID=687861 RepID=E6YZ74_BARSR|nr:hypothetical protein B11C_40017 [Bartonella schoenbuchensis R1]